MYLFGKYWHNQNDIQNNDNRRKKKHQQQQHQNKDFQNKKHV